jgi:hypothetical protein
MDVNERKKLLNQIAPGARKAHLGDLIPVVLTHKLNSAEAASKRVEIPIDFEIETLISAMGRTTSGVLLDIDSVIVGSNKLTVTLASASSGDEVVVTVI